MKKQTKTIWQRQSAFVAIASMFLLVMLSSVAVGQTAKYAIGDKVECDTTGDGTGFRKATVITFQGEERYNGYSSDSGYFYRVSIDAYTYNPEGMLCKTKDMRLQAKPAPPPGNQNTETESVQPNKQNADQTEDQDQGLKFKPGDRIECDKASIDSYEKGTVVPFLKLDDTSGKTYRVRLDAQARNGMFLEGIRCKADRMRLLAGEKPPERDPSVGKVIEDENNTLSADRPILDCPVEQKFAKNGSAPNAELLKKILRCGLGERAADTGSDGAITIDVTALQIGTPRPWDRLRDMGGGTPGKTFVYPVKVTFTEKTFYRSVTRVNENWIRIFNFFVNGFGEWQYGSAEAVKPPTDKNVPRDP